MHDWLIDLLAFRIDELCAKKFDGEITSGYIRSDDKIFRIHSGIPVLYPLPVHKRLKKVIIAYRKIPPDTWSVFRSDWFKYLREQQARLIVHGIDYLLRTRKTDNLNILAVGCGRGWEVWFVVKHLKSIHREMKFKVVGVDVALNALFEAKKISRAMTIRNVDFVCAPVEFLPFKNSTFDLVTAIFGALDHSLSYIRAFREISRVMKPSGVFIGTVINRFALDWIAKVVKSFSLFSKTIKYADKPFAFIRIPVKNGFVKIPTHFYTVLEVKKLLSMCNFRLIQLRGLFVVLPMNFKLRRFSAMHSILYKLDKLLSQAPILKITGRYLGFIAKRI